MMKENGEMRKMKKLKKKDGVRSCEQISQMLLLQWNVSIVSSKSQMHRVTRLSQLD